MINKREVRAYFHSVKEIFVLALPLMLMQFFGYMTGMIDIMMVGHVDEFNLAGLSLAVSVHSVIFMIFSSFGVPVLANISKLYAQERYDDIRKYFQQFLYFCIIFSVFLTIFFTNADFIFAKLDIQEKTRDIATDYLKILGIVNIFGCISSGTKNILRAFAKNKFLLS